MNAYLYRIGLVFGIIAPIITYASIFLAILHYPSFSWSKNALSDLGVRGISAQLFNTGLIAGGTLLTFFAFSLLYSFKDSLLGSIGATLFMLDALLLVGIGLFPETVEPVHHRLSVAFFILLPVALIFMGIRFVFDSYRKWVGLLALAVAAIAIFIWLKPWDGVAIPEAITSMTASLWTIITGVYLLKAKHQNT